MLRRQEKLEEKREDKMRDEPAEKHENETCKQEESLPNALPDPEPMEILDKAKKEPSVWRRARHFLGLRKPQKWRKTVEPTSNI